MSARLIWSTVSKGLAFRLHNTPITGVVVRQSHTTVWLQAGKDDAKVKPTGNAATFKATQQHHKKETKTIIINDKIEEHDLKSKIKHIKKWLAKGHSVHASIANQLKDATKSEEVYQSMLKELGQEGKFDSKQVNSKEIRFNIKPVHVEGSETSSSTPSTKTGKPVDP